MVTPLTTRFVAPMPLAEMLLKVENPLTVILVTKPELMVAIPLTTRFVAPIPLAEISLKVENPLTVILVTKPELIVAIPLMTRFLPVNSSNTTSSAT